MGEEKGERQEAEGPDESLLMSHSLWDTIFHGMCGKEWKKNNEIDTNACLHLPSTVNSSGMGNCRIQIQDLMSAKQALSHLSPGGVSNGLGDTFLMWHSTQMMNKQCHGGFWSLDAPKYMTSV